MVQMVKPTRLSNLLLHLGGGGKATDRDLHFLLSCSSAQDLQEIFETARFVRSRHFGNHVFLYGFLYFSTFCRNNCSFCQYRKANTELVRYRKEVDEILSAACEMAADGVHLIDVTMGEDPDFLNSGELGYERLISLASTVHRKTSLPLMISPGVIPDRVLMSLGNAGVVWYACYQETYNRELFHRLRPAQSFSERLERKLVAKDQGLLIEEGILTGVGENNEDIVQSIRAMEALGADQVRVMSFVPQAGTPLAGIKKTGNGANEFLIMAVMRLVLQDSLIPASLDVDGLAGLKSRLDAGANVITSLVPPCNGLAGVANQTLDIENAQRTVSSIGPIVKACGLTVADSKAYITWTRQRVSSKQNKKAGELRCGLQ